MNNPPTETESLAQGKRLVLAMLTQEGQPSPEDIRNAVNAVFGMLAGQGAKLDRDRLAKEVEAMTAVFQAESAGLRSEEGHIPWLSEAKNDRTWDFWERYRRYLEDLRNLPPRIVRRLDQSTEGVLGELEDPRRAGPWRRTGLVIGQVQSGKTGQYIGLAAKAVDAGYQFIVVLAGIHNDLRSQTQLRIDEGLLGFDTQHQIRSSGDGTSRLIGAGNMPGAPKLDIASPTNSSENGDFGKQAAKTVNFPLGSFPVVLVVKKHWKILNYLRKWVTDIHGIEDEFGRKTVGDIPLLVIDDEADNASINTTRDPDADPTRTNGAIRDLVKSFDKAAYVGYTATPFANIYIDPDEDHAELGSDLFPDSFIRNLPSPSNYLGPERVFGLRTDNEDQEDVPALPLVRYVNDSDLWMPSKHKSGFVPPDDLPRSLREAISSFVLSCAARKARGQTVVHNSMLVHVTRYTAVQERVREQVDDYLRFVIDTLQDRYGSAAQRKTQFQTLWEQDFVRTTAHFGREHAEPLSWEQVSEQLLPALRKIVVKAVNGTSRDALEYYEHRKNGFSVIAVGGEKLSRGLTLEGLTVSYYLRVAHTYDTLLQMGRWFGYRPGYEDLCRLYTTPTLEASYVEVTSATDELRREIEEMAIRGLTPKDFGLKIRSSSLGLGITAMNKMRQGTRVMLSYSGEGPETTIFDLSPATVDSNFRTLENFVEQLDRVPASKDTLKTGTLRWSGVSPETVVSEFLDNYVADSRVQRVRPRFIAKYIEQCAKAGELGSWTVCLINNSQAGDDQLKQIGGHPVRLITRRPRDPNCTEGRYTIRRVLSPGDEALDLSDPQIQAAGEESRKNASRLGKPEPKQTSGEFFRGQRESGKGLLLIYPITPGPNEGALAREPLVGFQVSFPKSEHRSDTEYVVNTIWLQEGIHDEDEEAEE